MQKKTKIISGLSLGFLLIGGTFAAYKYSDSIVNILVPGYSNSYTLEEVNKKILIFQQGIVNKIEKTYKSTLSASESQRITGSMGINIDANSSVGGGSGNMNIKNIDIQYNPSGLDILLEGFAIAGESQVFDEKVSGSAELGVGHLITNASGSYIKAVALAIDSSDFGEEFIPKEIIMTLNELGEANKYIDLSENFLYDILEAQLKSQTDNTGDIEKTIFDFMKNEPILVAYKQEETKYHLVPSKSICTLYAQNRKPTKDVDQEKDSGLFISSQLQGLEPITYEIFKNDFIECSDQEYDAFTENFLKSPWHQVSNLYIELNATKVHYVIDTILSTQEGEEFDFAIETGFEGTASLTQSESSKMYVRIKNEAVTGSGILIEQIGENINGYIDFNMPKYNFDSNMTMSGTSDNFQLSGDYSFIASEVMFQRDLQALKGIKSNGVLKGVFTPETYEMGISNTFSQEEFGISGEANLNINGDKVGDTNIGKMTFSGKVQLGANASPMNGEIITTWDTQTNETIAKGDISYLLNIPNIASGKYNINYDFNFSDILSSDFTTPENIIPQKNIDSLIMINKRIVQKRQKLKEKEELDAYKNGTQIPSIIGMEERDRQRMRDMKYLQNGLEQSYQDNAEYPTKENFSRFVQVYVSPLPTEKYLGYIKNGCEFGYKYELGDNSGIPNGRYRISTCFESEDNINLRANNNYDGGINSKALEIGHGVGRNDFIESFFISDIQ